MNTQREFFAMQEISNPPCQRHSETSKAAGTSVAYCLGALQTSVLEYLTSRGEIGATDEEIQCALQLNPSTQRPRRIELMRKGLVVAHGDRKTKSNRLATVWCSVFSLSRKEAI